MLIFFYSMVRIMTKQKRRFPEQRWVSVWESRSLIKFRVDFLLPNQFQIAAFQWLIAPLPGIYLNYWHSNKTKLGGSILRSWLVERKPISIKSIRHAPQKFTMWSPAVNLMLMMTGASWDYCALTGPQRDPSSSLLLVNCRRKEFALFDLPPNFFTHLLP